MVLRSGSAAKSSAGTVKYCIYGGYLIAILMSKNQCLENRVSALRIEVKGIFGSGQFEKDVPAAAKAAIDF